MRDVLRVRREQNHRQPECHDRERARKHPVGKTDGDDRRARDDSDADERGGVHRERALQHRAAADQNRRHRGLRRRGRRDDFETAQQFGRAVRARRGILREALHDERRELRRAVGAKRIDRRWDLAHVGDEQLVRREAGEGRTPREQLVRHASEGVDVGPVIGRGVARGLLGRHVGRRPHRGSQLRQRCARRRVGRCRDGLCDAEVGDDRSVPGEEHVVRLDVAMHDAVLVRVGERAREVAQDAHRLRDRQRPAP